MRGSEAAPGSRTYVPSAAGAGAARSWRARGTLGPSGASHRAASAGQGRAGWTARGALRGRGLPESGGPRWSLLSVPCTSQWRAVPSHAPGCLAPEGGRRGGRERGVGGTEPPGFAAQAFPAIACGGRAHAQRESNQRACAAQEDFRGEFSRLRPIRETLNTPIGWQATLS